MTTIRSPSISCSPEEGYLRPHAAERAAADDVGAAARNIYNGQNMDVGSRTRRAMDLSSAVPPQRVQAKAPQFKFVHNKWNSILSTRKYATGWANRATEREGTAVKGRY